MLLASISDHGSGELGARLTDVCRSRLSKAHQLYRLAQDCSRRLPSKRARAMYTVHPLRSSPKGTALSGIRFPSVRT